VRWTKRDCGIVRRSTYVAQGYYQIEKLPSRRWALSIDGRRLPEDFETLREAKEVAEEDWREVAAHSAPWRGLSGEP
jgi:hypothetical protein